MLKNNIKVAMYSLLFSFSNYIPGVGASGEDGTCRSVWGSGKVRKFKFELIQVARSGNLWKFRHLVLKSCLCHTQSCLSHNALCVLCSVGSSVLKNALFLIQSDRLSLSIIYRAIHLAQWGSSVSTTVSNSELSDCSVSTTELSYRSCIWYWVAFGRKFQF